MAQFFKRCSCGTRRGIFLMNVSNRNCGSNPTAGLNHLNPLPYPYPTFPLSFCHATPSFLTIHTTVGIFPLCFPFLSFFDPVPVLFLTFFIFGSFNYLYLLLASFPTLHFPFFQFSRFSVSTFICRKWDLISPFLWLILCIFSSLSTISFYSSFLLFSIRHFYSWKSNFSFSLPFYRFSVSLLFVEDDLSLSFSPFSTACLRAHQTRLFRCQRGYELPTGALNRYL